MPAILAAEMRRKRGFRPFVEGGGRTVKKSSQKPKSLVDSSPRSGL